MRSLPKLFIGIVIVIAIIAFIEMSISVYFANEFSSRHPGQDTPFPYTAPASTPEQH